MNTKPTITRRAALLGALTGAATLSPVLALAATVPNEAPGRLISAEQASVIDAWNDAQAAANEAWDYYCALCAKPDKVAREAAHAEWRTLYGRVQDAMTEMHKALWDRRFAERG